ncbi:MAG: hypothetical protein LBJ92_01190 [Holosporales bacterium]|nr:hypothetical protein [Holosporales bacterium]
MLNKICKTLRIIGIAAVLGGGVGHCLASEEEVAGGDYVELNYIFPIQRYLEKLALLNFNDVGHLIFEDKVVCKTLLENYPDFTEYPIQEGEFGALVTELLGEVPDETQDVVRFGYDPAQLLCSVILKNLWSSTRLGLIPQESLGSGLVMAMSACTSVGIRKPIGRSIPERWAGWHGIPGMRPLPLSREYSEDAWILLLASFCALGNMEISEFCDGSKPEVSPSPSWPWYGLSLSSGVGAVCSAYKLAHSTDPWNRNLWLALSTALGITCVGSAYAGLTA